MKSGIPWMMRNLVEKDTLGTRHSGGTMLMLRLKAERTFHSCMSSGGHWIWRLAKMPSTWKKSMPMETTARFTCRLFSQ